MPCDKAYFRLASAFIWLLIYFLFDTSMQNTIKYRVSRIFESLQKVQREKQLDRDTNSAKPLQSSKKLFMSRNKIF